MMEEWSQGIVKTASTVSLALLSLSVALSVIRLMIGPSLPDRVVALDLIATLAVGIMASYSVLTGETAVLDAAIIVGLVGFLGTVAFGRYVEKGGIK
jgi:multicomponent Na+:H+ antiporter subunit F